MRSQPQLREFPFLDLNGQVCPGAGRLDIEADAVEKAGGIDIGQAAIGLRVSNGSPAAGGSWP